MEDQIRNRENDYAQVREDGSRSEASLDSIHYNLLMERGKLEDLRAFLRYLEQQQ